MMTIRNRWPVAMCAIALFLAGLANAQEPGVDRAADDTPSATPDDPFAREMQEAEELLAEAARRVAELSAQRLDQAGGERRFFELSDKPRLGVNIENSGEDGPVDGVAVISVTPGSAAADAGLRAGDVITAINGESLGAPSGKVASERLVDFMQGVKTGDRLAVKYQRDGKSATVDVEPRPVSNNMFVWAPDSGNFTMPRGVEVHPAPLVVERFRFPFGGWRQSWGDMEVVELTEGLGRYFGTDEGLLVISAPKSNDFRLQDGDVIQSIDGRKPGSVDHCMRILASYQPGESLELKIMRDKRPQTLRVAIPEEGTGRMSPAQVPPALPQPPPAIGAVLLDRD